MLGHPEFTSGYMCLDVSELKQRLTIREHLEEAHYLSQNQEYYANTRSII